MATSFAFDNSHPVDLVNERLLILEDLLELAERAQAHTHATGSAVAIRDGDSLVVRTSTGVIPEVGATLKCGEGVIGKCSDKPYCGSPAPQDLDVPLVALRVRSLVTVPIRAEGEFLGALVITSQTPEAFSRIHTAILVAMASEAVRVVRRLQAVNGSLPAPSPAAKRTPEIEPPVSAVAPQVVPEKIQPVAPAVSQPIAQPQVVAPRPVEIPVARPVEPKPPQKIAPVSLIMTDDPVAQPTKPAAELLCPGEDPKKYGSLVTPPAERQSFTTGVVRYGATKRRTDWSKVIYAVAIIAAAGVAVEARPRLSRFLASPPAPPAEQAIFAPAPVAAATTSAPGSVRTTAATTVAATAAPATTITATTPTEPSPRHHASEEAAKAPAAVPQEQPVMMISAGEARQPSPVHVEAPSPTALTLANAASVPALPAPKVDKPVLSPATRTIAPPVLVRSVLPIYPEAARTRHIAGAVHLRLSVSNTGAITGVDVTDGSMLLRQAAIIAVRQWKYRPAMVDGRTISSTVDVTVNFSE